jgi:hypothetical protein
MPVPRAVLGLEVLESRETPNATVSAIAGVTVIINGDNTPNNVVITEGTPGQFTVNVNGADKGTFAARNILANFGSANDTFDLGVATTLPGYVTVNLGGGNDSFTTKNSTIGARLGGTLMVNTGPTNDFVSNYDETVELYNLDVVGPWVQVNGAPGHGTQLLDLQSTHVAGVLTARNMYVVSLGVPNDASGAATVNTLNVYNTYHNTDLRTDGPNGAGNALFMYSGSKVSRTLTYYGGAGRDDIDLPGDFPSAVSDFFVGGSLYFYGGGGTNTLALGNGQFGAHIGGSVLFNGGSGIDRFFFDSGSTVGGNVTLNLFGGANQVFGDSLGLGSGPVDPTGSASVAGNLLINLGAGNDFIDTYGAGASLFVGGNLTINAGSGFQLGGTAASPNAITFFNDNLTVGGLVSYNALAGSQTLEITGAGIADLTIRLGGGANTVNFLTTDFFGNLFVDFGIGPGPKAFETDAIPTTFHGRFIKWHI